MKHEHSHEVDAKCVAKASQVGRMEESWSDRDRDALIRGVVHKAGEFCLRRGDVQRRQNAQRRRCTSNGA